MKDERQNQADNRPTDANAAATQLTPRSEMEKEAWEALEQARQNVKPVVKKEIEAEVVTSELLNLRLRIKRDD